MLTDKSDRNDTAKLCEDCFVRRSLIMVDFIRAERKLDRSHHLWTVSQMVPYLFASAHVNYVWYVMFYFRSMEFIPTEVQSMFLQCQHIVKHVCGASNTTWSGMFIE